MATATKSQMQALIAPKYCTPDKYEIAELPKPEIKDLHDVLVKIYVASINPHDVKEAKGLMRPLTSLASLPLLGHP